MHSSIKLKVGSEDAEKLGLWTFGMSAELLLGLGVDLLVLDVGVATADASSGATLEPSPTAHAASTPSAPLPPIPSVLRCSTRSALRNLERLLGRLWSTTVNGKFRPRHCCRTGPEYHARVLVTSVFFRLFFSVFLMKFRKILLCLFFFI